MFTLDAPLFNAFNNYVKNNMGTRQEILVWLIRKQLEEDGFPVELSETIYLREEKVQSK